ncbi:hypothetical protein FRB99_007931 [Tulasnella sp. 403]|nr:hypothetical protein FRB99_007931 [Tulasnella sp. 403]
MSTMDFQQPSIVSRVNSSRYFISSSTSLQPSPPATPEVLKSPSPDILSLSSTARRIARKRGAHIYSTFAYSTSSTSSSIADKTTSFAAQTSSTDLVTLGTIDLGNVIRSLALFPSQSTSKPRKISPPASTAITPPPTSSSSRSLHSRPLPPISTSSVSSTPIAAPAQSASSSTFRLHIPVMPRPGPRLPLFHPDNKTPLPDISQQPTLIHTGPSPPPARRSSARARKPAAKAMALSLGLASDGSGLDVVEPNREVRDKESHAATSKDDGDRSVKHGKSAKPERSQEDHEVDNADTPKTVRRAPKRKAAMAIDALVEMEDDSVSSTQVPATKRPRRGGEHTAATHAPSPLSNELARGPGSPPLITTALVNNARKRKADTPVDGAPEEEAAGTPPPQATSSRSKSKPSKTANGKVKSGAGTKKSDKNARKTEEPEEDVRKRVRSNSSTGSGDEKEQVHPDNQDKKESKDDQDEDEDMEEEDDGEHRRSVNIFEQPLELKPRPRPTYKTHLKRISTGSAGDGDRPSRARKPRRSNTSRGHSRKESEDISPTTSVDGEQDTAEKPSTVTEPAGLSPAAAADPLPTPAIQSVQA